MPVTPTDNSGLTHRGVALLLAASAKFQEITGAGDADEAIEFIYWDDAPEDAVAPLAVIDTLDAIEDSEYIGTGNTYSFSGEIDIYLELPFTLAETDKDDESDPQAIKDAYDTVRTIYGTIMDEMRALFCIDRGDGVTHINGKSLKKISGPGGPENARLDQRIVGLVLRLEYYG